MLKRIWRFFFPVKVCRKHWFGVGAGEGPCPVCGTVVTFKPRKSEAVRITANKSMEEIAGVTAPLPETNERGNNAVTE